MDRRAEIERRTRAQRFRLRRAEYAPELRRLLGSRITAEPLDDVERATALATEFWVALHAAEPHDWALLTHEWPVDDAPAIGAVLQRLATNLGPRPVWLLTAHREPQATALDSDAVLANPLAFAAVSDYDLRLRDREVVAGLWLGRHSHFYGSRSVRYTWELNVWGEPWLPAATRALRQY